MGTCFGVCVCGSSVFCFLFCGALELGSAPCLGHYTLRVDLEAIACGLLAESSPAGHR